MRSLHYIGGAKIGIKIGLNKFCGNSSISRLATTGIHIYENGPENTLRPVQYNTYILFKLDSLSKTDVC